MTLRVEMYLGEVYIPPDEYQSLVITAPETDKIVNCICDACNALAADDDGDCHD